MNEEPIILIQRLVRQKLNIKNKLQQELDFTIGLTNKIIKRINQSYSLSIIADIQYKQYMDLLDNCLSIIDDIPKKLTLRNMNNTSQYKRMIKIAKMKLECIKIIQKTGSESICDLFKLFFNIPIDASELDTKYIEYTA